MKEATIEILNTLDNQAEKLKKEILNAKDTI